MIGNQTFSLTLKFKTDWNSTNNIKSLNNFWSLCLISKEGRKEIFCLVGYENRRNKKFFSTQFFNHLTRINNHFLVCFQSYKSILRGLCIRFIDSYASSLALLALKFFRTLTGISRFISFWSNCEYNTTVVLKIRRAVLLYLWYQLCWNDFCRLRNAT